MSADWSMWLLTVIAAMSGVSAFAQSFNAIHQLWINLHNMRKFWSTKFGRTHSLSRNDSHARAGIREFGDFLINLPTMNNTKRLVERGKPESVSFSEQLEGSKIQCSENAKRKTAI